MKTKDVWFNRGRWFVRCPVCGSKTAIKPSGSQKEIKFYCGACYSGKIAKIPVLLSSGGSTWAFDHKAQRAAAQAAKDNGEIYTAVLPVDWKKAEDLLRVRRTPHMGFYPGDFKAPNNKKETIADLKRENASDPVLSYLWADPPVENLKPIPIEEFEAGVKPNKKKLTDAEFRRLQ